MNKVTGYVTAPDGTQVCPTDKCGAFCCQTSSCFPDKSGPCEFLQEDLSCYLHVHGGRSCKPRGCNDFPRNQYDVDIMNRDAKGNFRCWLKVETT
jgi:hypothetical protein